MWPLARTQDARDKGLGKKKKPILCRIPAGAAAESIRTRKDRPVPFAGHRGNVRASASIIGMSASIVGTRASMVGTSASITGMLLATSRFAQK